MLLQCHKSHMLEENRMNVVNKHRNVVNTLLVKIKAATDEKDKCGANVSSNLWLVTC